MEFYPINDLEANIILSVNILDDSCNAVTNIWIMEDIVRNELGEVDFENSFDVDLGTTDRLVGKEIYIVTFLDAPEGTDLKDIVEIVLMGGADTEGIYPRAYERNGNIRYSEHIKFIYARGFFNM